MLSHTTMGWVALWILWGNTLLVAVVALRQARALVARASRFGALTRAKVEGDAPLCEHRVEQLGRVGAGDEPSIVWHDKSFSAALLGGALRVGDESVAVEPGGEVEVWLDEQAVQGAASAHDAAGFEAAFQEAQKPRGFRRTVSTPIRPGTEVFVSGEIARADGRAVLRPLPDQPLLVATLDPVAYARRRAAFAWLVFLPGVLVGAAVPTALALTAPVFEGWTSKLGALLGLGFFLIVLPAGTALRDFLRDPQRRFVRGRWVSSRS